MTLQSNADELALIAQELGAEGFMALQPGDRKEVIVGDVVQGLIEIVLSLIGGAAEDFRAAPEPTAPASRDTQPKPATFASLATALKRKPHRKARLAPHVAWGLTLFWVGGACHGSPV